MSGINVTPLVDVTLTLLVIFIITAPTLFQELPVNLPQSVVGQAQMQAGIVISVDQGGSIRIDREPVDATQFGPRFVAALAGRGDAPVFVRADQQVPYGRVVEIVGQVKAAGVERVGLVVETAGQTPAQR
jgi:biopolymer transport protein TolR